MKITRAAEGKNVAIFMYKIVIICIVESGNLSKFDKLSGSFGLVQNCAIINFLEWR